MRDVSPARRLLLSLRKRLRPFDLILILTGITTLFVAVIEYIAVARQIQLVSIDKQIVYPGESTGDFALPLFFHNEPANDVWTAKIEILNAGSTFIGEQDSIWRLFVSSDNSEFIEALEDYPDVVPSFTVHTKIIRLKPNIVAVDLGVFESKSRIALNIMVVNPEKGQPPQFEVSSSLPGVAKPKPGQSLQGQFTERFLPIFLVPGFVVVAYLYQNEFRELVRQDGIKVWVKALVALIIYIVGWFVIVLLASMFCGAGGWYLLGPILVRIRRNMDWMTFAAIVQAGRVARRARRASCRAVARPSTWRRPFCRVHALSRDLDHMHPLLRPQQTFDPIEP